MNWSCGPATSEDLDFLQGTKTGFGRRTTQIFMVLRIDDNLSYPITTNHLSARLYMQFRVLWQSHSLYLRIPTCLHVFADRELLRNQQTTLMAVQPIRVQFIVDANVPMHVMSRYLQRGLLYMNWTHSHAQTKFNLGWLCSKEMLCFSWSWMSFSLS